MISRLWYKIDKKKFFLINKLNLLIILLIVLLMLVPFSFSRYESQMTSNTNLDAAIYLINDTYAKLEVRLPEIVPQNEQYAYTFSISNNLEGQRTETNLYYVLNIVTTTNLPLEYALYDGLDVNNANNIIISDEYYLDDYQTWFRKLSTERSYFTYSSDEINYYTLLISFPLSCNDASYQSIVESIVINIDSKQVLSSDT